MAGGVKEIIAEATAKSFRNSYGGGSRTARTATPVGGNSILLAGQGAKPACLKMAFVGERNQR